MIYKSELPVKPRDCGLFFGLPLTKEEVFRDLDPASGKDWVRHFSSERRGLTSEGLWSNAYFPEIVKPSEHLIAAVKKMDVTVYTSGTLAALAEAARKHIVLTLVSHWMADGKIELLDGLHSPQVVADALPAGYDGVFDLVICQSIKLSEVVKQVHPNCACPCNAKPTTLKPKLLLYGETLIALEEGNLRYVDALRSTYLRHLQKKKSLQ